MLAGKIINADNICVKKQKWLCNKIYYNKFNTVEPVLSGHSKLDKTKISMTNGSLMQVKSIADPLYLTCIKGKLVLKTKFLPFFQWPF